MNPGDKLFVYGSLRKGRGNDLSKHEGSTFVGKDRVNGRLYDVSWFPGVIAESAESFNPDEPAVIGEVFVVGTAQLAEYLDNYEGYPSLFGRIQTTTEKGERVWVYTFNRIVGESQLIRSGDYDDVREMEVGSVDES